jgi:peptidoglycan-N-acetylmuramic acid deacetylase
MQRGVFLRKLLAACCVLVTLGTMPGTAETVQAADNTQHDWYVVRKSNHEKAGGGIPSGIDLSKYDAYYMDTATDEKVIYFSFDCGYENGYTKKILKTLKRHHAKAIFFVTGWYIKSHPEIVKQMKEEGHLVGSHTANHKNMAKLSTAQIKSELNECARLMKEKAGYEIDPYVRPPEGSFSVNSLRAAQSLGYHTIFWSMAYYDYDVNNQPGKDYVVNHFKQNYHKGALPLMHNTSSSNCAALDDVLTYLEGQGYRFGRIDEFTLPEGTLRISCKNKAYDGKAATIRVVKNTNKSAEITYHITDEEGNEVSKAVKPGVYTVEATVEDCRSYRGTTSNKVTFTIGKKHTGTF